MKRNAFTLSFLFSFLLLQPLAASAASFDPSTLLQLVTSDTAPMEFQIIGSNAGTTVMWSGLQEGKGSQWYKLKGDMKVMQASVTSRYKVLVYDGMMYMSMQSEGTTQGKWAAWSFDGQNPGSAMDSAFGALVGGNGMTFVGEAWGRIFSNAGNLSLTEDRFQGGRTYSLKLTHPSSSERVHVKVDTDNDLNFLHIKFYNAIGSNAIEGRMQHSGKPVYLDIPSVTIDVDDLMIFGGTPKKTAMKTYMQSSSSSRSSMTSSMNSYQPRISDRSRPTPVSPYEIMPSMLTIPDDNVPFMVNMSQFVKSKTYRTQQHAPASSWQPQLRAQGNKYEKLTSAFMDLAVSNEVYEMTSLLSRKFIMDNSAETVQKWLKEQIIPFFSTVDLTVTPETIGIYRAEDPATGQNGIAVHEAFRTKAGMEKSFIVFIVQEKGYHSVIQSIYIDASPRDLGILEGKIQAHTNLEEYMTPINGIQVAFDNRDWTLAYNSEMDGHGTAKFVLPGQTTESWTEIVTVRYMTTNKSIDAYAKDFAMNTSELCSGVDFTLIDNSPNNIKAELHTDCSPYMSQHELMRIFRSGSTVYHISYTANTTEMGSGTRTVWLDLLDEAYPIRVQDQE